MKNGIKRIGKGLFAIFMIKLTLLSGVLIFQACQTENTFEDESYHESKTNFLTALQESNKKLRSIVVTPTSFKGNQKGNELAKENTNEITTFKMCLLLDGTSGDSSITVNPNDDSVEVTTIDEVYNAGDETGTRPVLIDNTTNEPLDDTITDFGFSMCFDIPTEETVEALEPSIVEARNFFYAQGYNDDDITEMLDGEDESMLVPTVIAIISAENSTTNYAQNFELQYLSGILGIPVASAQDTGDIIGCAMVALGLDIFSELRAAANAGQRIGRELIKRTIKTVGKRLLGPIGVFVAILEFGACLAIAA